MVSRFRKQHEALSKRACLAPERRRLTMTLSDNETQVQVPAFTVHAMVVAEFMA